MDFINFSVEFLVDELSGDSEHVDSSVGVAAGSAVACRDAPEWALHGQYGQLDDGDDDRESAVDSGSEDMEDSEVDGGEDGREVGDRDRDDDDGGDLDAGEEESMRWWAAPEVGHRYNEEMDERRRMSTPATDRIEEAKERDRRFWETCLASGYP